MAKSQMSKKMLPSMMEVLVISMKILLVTKMKVTTGVDLMIQTKKMPSRRISKMLKKSRRKRKYKTMMALETSVTLMMDRMKTRRKKMMMA